MAESLAMAEAAAIARAMEKLEKDEADSRAESWDSLLKNGR